MSTNTLVAQKNDTPFLGGGLSPSEVTFSFCKGRFSETAGQNFFILGGDIPESHVFHILQNWVKGQGQGHAARWNIQNIL